MKLPQAISSRLIPPKLGAKFFIELIISFASLQSISRSIESMSANLLNARYQIFFQGTNVCLRFVLGTFANQSDGQN